MTRLILPLLLAMVAGCAKPTAVTSPWVSPPPGSFLSATAQPLSDADVVKMAKSADFILMGESHTNLCDHALQARFIEALAEGGTRFSIGLEMLPVTAQPVLDRFNARRISAADIGHEVGWEKLWGYPYAQYRPIFELAEKFDLPVAGLNIPRQVLTTFRDKGNEALSQSDRNALPRRIIPASPAQKAALEEQVGIHQSMREASAAGTMPKAAAPKAAPGDMGSASGKVPSMGDMAEKFFLVQAMWDSMMAEQALKWRDRLGIPMFILAGGGHVEHGWGIEYRLRTLDPDAACLAIMPVRDAEDFKDQTDVTQRPLPGNSIYFYCASQHKSRLGMNIVFETDRMIVDSVDPESRAEKAGLLAGDILLKAEDKPLTEATDLHFAAMAASRQKKPLQLTILRAQQTLTVNIALD
jgi:uncharacterized iron-regulated protein